MKLNNTKNATRNIATGIAARIVSMLLQFIFRTVFIYRLGVEYLGLNSLFSSILNVLNLAELGICASIIYCMYKPIAEDDNDTICALMNFFRKCYYVIGLIILLVGLAVIPFLSKIVTETLPNDVNLYILYLLVLGNTVASYYLYSYKVCLLNAYQRTDIKNVYAIWMGFLQYAVQITLILLIPDYYIYLITNIIFTLASNIIIAKKVDRVFPDLKPRGDINRKTKIEIVEKVKGMLVYKLSGVLSSSFDTFVISSFLGLAVLGKLNNYYFISSTIASVLGICTASITAGIGNSLVLKSKKQIIDEYDSITFIYSWLVGWCSICIVCLSQDFIKIWAGNNLQLSFIVALEIAVLFYVTQAFAITDVYRGAAGLWDKDKVRPLISALFNLALNFYLVQYLGVVGVLFSSILVGIIFNIGWGTNVLFKYTFQTKIVKYYFRLIYLVLVTIISGLLTWYVSDLIMAENILGLFVKFLICCIVPNIIYFCFVFKMKGFGSAIVFIKRIVSNIIAQR